MLPDLPDHVLLDGALGGRDLATIEAVSCRFRLKSAELEDGSSGGAAGAGAPGGVAGGEAGGGEVEAGSRGHDRIPPNGICWLGAMRGVQNRKHVPVLHSDEVLRGSVLVVSPVYYVNW
jgi:hypothetical protein